MKMTWMGTRLKRGLIVNDKMMKITIIIISTIGVRIKRKLRQKCAICP